MSSPNPPAAQLLDLLDQAARPVYVVDAARRIVFANRALVEWLGIAAEKITGRLVEYHSQPPERDADTAPLAGLCPPPRALAGNETTGTVSCVNRAGHLVHRRGRFLPLAPISSGEAGRGGDKPPASAGVIAIVEAHDLSPAELARSLSAEPTTDELHRAIRRFRRGQAAGYAIDAVLGESSAMRKVRAQIAAAAAGMANVLVIGPAGSGRDHVARAIHYHTSGDEQGLLLPLDCKLATQEQLRRTFDSLRDRGRQPGYKTLLLSDADALAPELQAAIAETIGSLELRTRVIATLATSAESQVPHGADPQGNQPAGHLQDELLDVISTITIEIPRLVDRVEDLPILSQAFVEAANRNHPRQIAGLTEPALDLLALYRWPGEVDELRDVIIQAHAACQGHHIAPDDLPAVIRHAAQSASLLAAPREEIVLDSFLAEIETELIQRALHAAKGNKAEAARLLGMPRPRLYRRLVQLGLEEASGNE